MIRNQLIDVAKFIAVAGVVFIHVSPSVGIAAHLTHFVLQFSVPFFVITSMYFVLQGEVQSFERIHYRRLLFPYVIWTSVYMLLRLVKHYLVGDERSWDVLGIVFFGKASTGLYFIPMLLSYQLICLSVLNLWRWKRNSVRFNLLCVAVISSLLLLSMCLRGGGYLGFNNNMFLLALVYGMLARLIYLLIGDANLSVSARRFTSLAMLLVIAMLIALKYCVMWNSSMNAVMAAALLTVCMMSKNLVFPPLVGRIVSCSFGVYLIHTIFDQFFEIVYLKILGGKMPYVIGHKVVMWLVVLVSTTWTVYVLRRHAWFRKFFVGEFK